MSALPLGSASPSGSSWHLAETYKALITIAVEALKMLALVSGGAAVAVLTYLGNLVTHSSAGTPPPDVTPALLWYCGGLVATVIAFVVAYVTQLVLYNEEKRRQGGKVTRQYHACGVWLGVTLAIVAALAFGQGCLVAAHALNTVHP